MTTQEYISSGIVESYVLGLADQAEREEFERMSSLHPEVRAAREAFELALEEQMLAAAVPPPASIKQSILDKIAAAEEQQSETPVVPLKPDVRLKQLPVDRWIKYLAAASVLLLVASAALNIYLFSQYKSFSNKYADLLASQTEMASNNQAMQTRLDQYQNTISMFKDSNMSVIKMQGSSVPAGGSPDPSSLATVLWNTKTKDVFLLVNHLPAPASEQQYQLWAIVDGKPVDAGVFDMADNNTVLHMKNIPEAQLFAVTLEKKGGNPTPQGKMYVLGKI